MICPKCRNNNRDDARFCGKCGTSFTGVLTSGTVIKGRYQIVKYIAQGGMGIVYLITDSQNPTKKLALKELILSFESKEDENAKRSLFKREADLYVKLNHPYILKGYDYFYDSATTKEYLVMDFIDGTRLDKFLEKIAPGSFLNEKDVLKWIGQICQAIDYLHNLNPKIIYRDMKPDNAMLRKTGDIILLDLGIAREYKGYKKKDTSILGTPGYAPLEQYGSKETDERSDIYALGATGDHLFTGQVPLQSPLRFSTAGKLTGQQADFLKPPRVLNPNISIETESIILKAMAMKPEDRYQTAKEMLTEINRLLGGTLHQPVISIVTTPVPTVSPQITPQPSTHIPTQADVAMAKSCNNQGLAYAKAGNYQKAVLEYQKAIQYDPGNSVYHYNLSIAYYELKRFLDALTACQRATALYSKDDDYFNQLNRIYYQLGKYNDALLAIQSAIKLAPHMAVYHYNEGTIYQSLKDYNRAIDSYKKALSIQKDISTYIKLADVYIQQGAIGNAENILKQAIIDYPASHMVHNRLGNIYLKKDNLAGAIMEYSQCIRLQSKEPVYYANLGYAYYHQNRYLDAVNQYQRAIQLSPNNAEWHNNLGDVYFAMKDYIKSVTEYQIAVNLNPRNTLYFSDLASAYEKLNRFKDAILAMKDAIKLDPNRAMFYNRLGTLYFYEKNYQQALNHHIKALRMNSNNAMFAYNVGTDYYALGNIQDAIKNYELALILNPNLASAKEGLKKIRGY
jgi:serine/threonine protein kinase